MTCAVTPVSSVGIHLVHSWAFPHLLGPLSAIDGDAPDGDANLPRLVADLRFEVNGAVGVARVILPGEGAAGLVRLDPDVQPPDLLVVALLRFGQLHSQIIRGSFVVDLQRQALLLATEADLP